MRARIIHVKQSKGRTLLSTIVRPDGRKVLPKGHLIREEDARMLESEGLIEVWVTELEEGEVGEDHAVLEIAGAIACGSVEVRIAAGGRANLVTTEQACVLVDDALLKEINGGASFAIATSRNFSCLNARQRVATVNSVPFAVVGQDLAEVMDILKGKGPIIQARAIRTPAVGVLYCDPFNGDRARELFESIMLRRLSRFAITGSLVVSSLEEEAAVARALRTLLDAQPTCVIIASTTAPAGPDDVVGRAMIGAGCKIERFMAPVEPGNLLLLGYKEDTPIVSAPGCFRSAKWNVLDVILPPLLARYRLSARDIAGLGHGGLLSV